MEVEKTIKCPKCGSSNIGQFRMMTGPVWCCECDYKVEQKEYFNPFVISPEELTKNK